MSEPSWLGAEADNVLDAVVDAILTIDAEGVIRSANASAVTRFGYPKDELLGMPVHALMPEPYRTQHQTFVSNYLAQGQAKIIGIGRELVAQDRDGHVFPIYLAVSELDHPDGKRFVGIVRDLSEQKAAEAALMEQREHLSQVSRLSTMGEMTASIAHEINQPLTAIAMYSQAALKILEQENVDTTKLKDALDKLNRQSLRAGAVIERVQKFVRHEDGERRVADVNALVRELRHLADGDARMHGMTLAFELAEDLPPVLCDSVQIQQVALNLIRNAIDAMQEINCVNGDTIVVRTHRIGDWVEVAVVDCGTGVAEKDSEMLFSAFHTTKVDGMGMGLSICKSILDEHDGMLSYFNNPTKGATFYFRLPVVEDAT